MRQEQGAPQVRGTELHRVRWKIPGWGEGHGDWMQNSFVVNMAIIAGNEKYGEGTHWRETVSG